MKSSRLFTFIFFLFLFSNQCLAVATIKGTIPELAGKTGQLFEFLDYLSSEKKQFADFKIDENGVFEHQIEKEEDQLLRLKIGNNFLNFYVKNEMLLEIGYAEGRLKILQEFNSEINEKVREINLRLWKHYDKYFGKNPKKIVEGLDKLDDFLLEMEEEKNEFIKKVLYYTVFEMKIKFLSQYKTPEIRRRLEEIDAKFISNPSQLDNPRYVAAFRQYIFLRVIMIKWNRDNNFSNIYQELQEEAIFYKKSPLEDLAKAMVIEWMYAQKWYEDKSNFKQKAESLVAEMSDLTIKNIGQKLIKLNHQINEGDVFPAATLINNLGDSINIQSVEADYILIDCFATWCSGCRQEMRKFNGYRQQYGDKLAIITISRDNKYEDMTKFVNKHNYKWQFLYDGLDGELSRILNIGSYPTYFILDKDKKIISISDEKFDLKEELANIIK